MNKETQNPTAPKKELDEEQLDQISGGATIDPPDPDMRKSGGDPNAVDSF